MNTNSTQETNLEDAVPLISVRFSGNWVFKCHVMASLDFTNEKQWVRLVSKWMLEDENFEKAYLPYYRDKKIPIALFREVVRRIWGEQAKIQFLMGNGTPFGAPITVALPPAHLLTYPRTD